MNARTRIAQTIAAATATVVLALPAHAIRAASADPAPFDACNAVDVRAAAHLIGGPIRDAKPNLRQIESEPRQSALCAYDGVNNGELSVLLLRFGSSAKDRDSLATFRSSYERAASSLYGKPSTATNGDATVVTFKTESGSVLDVAAFTNGAVARITLTFGKARTSELDALALSLVRGTYGPAPAASPSIAPDISPCGRRTEHAEFRG